MNRAIQIKKHFAAKILVQIRDERAGRHPHGRMPKRPIAIGRVCAKSVELGGRANEQIGHAIPIDIPGGDPGAREHHAVDPHSPFAGKPIGTRAVNLQFPKAIERVSEVCMGAGDGKFDYPVSVQIRATADPTRVSRPG